MTDYPARYLSCGVCKVTAGQLCWERQGYVLTEDGLIDVSRTLPIPHNSRKTSTKGTPPAPRTSTPAAPARTARGTRSVQTRRTAQQQATINAWTRHAAERKRP